MSCCDHNGKMDDSLLFFFLILVLLFCKPGSFGCGCEEFDSCESTCC